MTAAPTAAAGAVAAIGRWIGRAIIGAGISSIAYNQYRTLKGNKQRIINNNPEPMGHYTQYPVIRGGPSSLYTGNYRRYRRAFRRYGFRRYKGISPYFKGATAILDHIRGVSIGDVQSGSVLQLSVSMGNMLLNAQGWTQYAALYNQFRIYFVKIELLPTPPNTIINSSVVQNFIYNNPVFYYLFEPSNDQMTVQQIYGNNYSGRSSASGINKKALRRFRKTSSIPGYGTPMTTSDAGQITGNMHVATTAEVFQGGAPGATDICSIHVFLYVQFSNANA
ncbi:capsid protein [Gopherus associated circular DNA virus 8]|nr:capsid protein [Gopherus associated circular DNA virus 8]